MTERLRTLQSLVSRLPKVGDRPFVVEMQEEGAEHQSYAELADRVRRLARGLIDTGVGRGDPVALLAPNSPEWIAACLAVIEAGAVIVPLDAGLSDEELSHALSDSGAKLIFTTGRHVERLEDLDLEKTPEPVLLDADKDDKRSWRNLLADNATEPPRVEPEDLAALFYTSGTTGRAKGVPLSHRNLVFQPNALVEAGVVWEDDRVLLPLPLHHVYPFAIGMLTPLALGLPIVLPRSLTGPQLVRAMREGEVSVVVGVPRLYDALYSGLQERAGSAGVVPARLFETAVNTGVWARKRTGRSPGKLILRPLHRRFSPKLRVLASGGAPLDEDLAWKLEGLGWKVAIGYGLTETSPLLTLNPPEGSKLASVGRPGRPIPGIELCVDSSAIPGASGEERRTQRPGEEGEILARGPGVFSGYRNMPEETEEVLTEDGWFRTGDLGYFDEDSYLYVTGRASTLIVTKGGKNLQPEEIEEAYLKSSAIREIGVMQRDGRLVALIVPETSEVQHADDLTSAIREAVSEVSQDLPSHKRISDFAITRASLEYTQLGKLRRHVLEERYEQVESGEERPEESPGPVPPEEMSEEDRTLLEDPASRQVWDWLPSRYPDRRLAPETSLQMDLGVDSLEWVNLTMEIGQRTGVELEEEAIERIEKVRDLLREVSEAGEAERLTDPLERPEEALDDRQKRWLEPLDPKMVALARVLFVLNLAVMRGPFRLRVEGLKNLPEGGQFVLTPHHTSYLDPFAIAAALGYRRLRRTYWGGRTGALLANPLNRFVSRLAQAVPVGPHRAGVSSLAFGAAVLKRGNNLVWFPEGTRSRTGELQQFRPGVGLLLKHFRVPVVPVFICGTGEAMPRGQALPRFAKITVTFGTPLDPGDLEEQGKGEAPEERISSTLQERVAELGKRP